MEVLVSQILVKKRGFFLFFKESNEENFFSSLKRTCNEGKLQQGKSGIFQVMRKMLQTAHPIKGLFHPTLVTSCPQIFRKHPPLTCPQNVLSPHLAPTNLERGLKSPLTLSRLSRGITEVTIKILWTDALLKSIWPPSHECQAAP